MRYTLPLLLLTMSCCGIEVKDPRRHTTSDVEFNAYVTKFKEDHQDFTGNPISVGGTVINFGTPSVNAVGTCYQYGTGHSEIIIDRDYWVNSSYDTQEVLIYHELGHCVLGKEHVDNSTSIMSKELINGWYYNVNSFEILEGFFQ